MKKVEAEKAIRYLATEWVSTLSDDEKEHPSFSSFKVWLRTKGYDHYLNFRSRMGANYDAELWFDQELKQTWRR